MPRPKKQDDAAPATSSTTTAAPNIAADAFAKVEAELTALPAESLAPVTVDLAAAIATVHAAAPRLRDHRQAIADQLPRHPLRPLDELETYAHAAWYAHLLHAYSSAGPESAKALQEEASVLREGLLIAAEALAHRALLDADAVARLRKSATPDIAADLTALAMLFRESWGRVSTKTAVERHEIDRAAELGPAVLVATAAKKHRDTDTELQRTRAFNLLASAYDTCRQALTYLRWKEGDVDVVAPSLFKKRPGRKPGKKDDEPEVAPEANEPAAS
jgi:hypothetical protein